MRPSAARAPAERAWSGRCVAAAPNAPEPPVSDAAMWPLRRAATACICCRTSKPFWHPGASTREAAVTLPCFLTTKPNGISRYNLKVLPPTSAYLLTNPRPCPVSGPKHCPSSPQFSYRGGGGGISARESLSFQIGAEVFPTKNFAQPGPDLCSRAFALVTADVACTVPQSLEVPKFSLAEISRPPPPCNSRCIG